MHPRGGGGEGVRACGGMWSLKWGECRLGQGLGWRGEIEVCPHPPTLGGVCAGITARVPLLFSSWEVVIGFLICFPILCIICPNCSCGVFLK